VQVILYYIMAGAHEQAKHLAKQMKLSNSEWTHVSRHEQLQGIRNGVLLMYGTWRARENMDEFMELARTREMTILYIYD
jgi:hypothetical protein